jgi:hypothetical protein
MNCELEMIWREAVVSRHRLEGLRKNTKNIQDTQSLGLDWFI